MSDPDPTPLPLDHLALRGARRAVAIEDKAGTLSHHALDLATGAVAASLLRRGLSAGDRVAAWTAKSRLACVLPLACARAGLVHVPINPVLKRAQAAHILADSGAALLIAGAARLATLEAGERPEAIEEHEAGGWLEGEGLPASHADPGALVQILYTSGSTGRPKGVMLSHANLWLGAIAVAHYTKLAADDVVLAALPLSFDYGQNQLLSAWAAGARVMPLDYLLPQDVVKACARHGVTTLAGVPPLWVQLAEAKWPDEVAARVRRLTNTGGRLAVPLGRRLRGLFPQAALYSMYGLTEAFRSTWLDPALYDAHPDAIGRAIPFAEVMVARGDGTLAADGEAGELVHAGPLVAQGYWRDAERTALRYRPAPAGSAYGGTAVWSGDTVVRGGDGLLRFVGRDDEMIKSSGNRISPTEIEEAALASGEASEAAAFGVQDERLGQAVRLVVAGAGDDAALAAWLKRELPGFMQPQAIRRVQALPRNPNGKLDRVAIAQGVVVKAAGAIPPGFAAGDDGVLRVGGVSAERLAAEAGDTPLFVYDLALVRAKVAAFRAAFPGVQLHYALKANPFAPLVRAMVGMVDGIDVASVGELGFALAGGAGDISFAGPGKRDRELAAAIDAGVTLNLESEGEAERALRIAAERCVRPRLAVRVNPDFVLKGSGMKMGGGAKPFGIDAARVPALVRSLIARGADWRGLHIFAGSQALDAASLIETQAATLELAARIAEAAGVTPPLVNLGGGFGIPYFPGDRVLDVAAVGAALSARLAERPASLSGSRFAIELGRWLVGEAGVYLTRVVDVKTSHGETFVVVDGGLHHQLAASGNFGTVVRRNYPIANASRFAVPATATASVVGCLCTPLDRLGDQVGLPETRVGDLIALFMAGAYGRSASPEAFLGHPAPGELLVDGDAS